jgi:hypothetical protein
MPERYNHIAISLATILCIHGATTSARAESSSTDRFVATMFTTSTDASTSSLENAETLLSVTTVGALSTVGGVITTIYYLIQGGAERNATALRAYILHERESLMAAHAVGGGDTVDDMATMLWIPAEHRALLGASMRQRRAALDALLTQTCEDAATCDALADRYLATLIAAIHARPEAHEPITLSP